MFMALLWTLLLLLPQGTVAAPDSTQPQAAEFMQFAPVFSNNQGHLDQGWQAESADEDQSLASRCDDGEDDQEVSTDVGDDSDEGFQN